MEYRCGGPGSGRHKPARPLILDMGERVVEVDQTGSEHFAEDPIDLLTGGGETGTWSEATGMLWDHEVAQEREEAAQAARRRAAGASRRAFCPGTPLCDQEPDSEVTE
jgi:hypothetical protein